MKTQILAHSDLSIKTWGTVNSSKILDGVLNINFFDFDRILHFLPASFNGLTSGRFQTTEHFFLCKTGFIRLLSNYFLYEKGDKKEKLRIAVSDMNFNIMDENIVKIGDLRLKF
jgi:hypothetical protein